MKVMSSLYTKKTGFVLDEERDNESLASTFKDLMLKLLKG